MVVTDRKGDGMRKLMFLGAIIGLRVLATDAKPAGPAGAITTPGAGATTFEGTLQEPPITTAAVLLTRPAIIGDRAKATSGASLQEPGLGPVPQR